MEQLKREKKVLTKEEKEILKDAFITRLKANPRIKFEKENTPEIVSFENSFYLKGSLHNCINLFRSNLNKCYLWCYKNKCNNIYFFINSSGGSVRVYKECLKQFQKLKDWNKNLKIKIECIVIKYCCSAAVYLALECDTVKLYKDAKMGIHYPINITYKESCGEVIDVDNEEKPLSMSDKMNTEEYFISKLKLEKEIVETILKENKLLFTEEILRYNLAKEVIEYLPEQFEKLKLLIKNKV
jgi:ATP-dependent protease ClpP protease subunit